MKAVILFVLVPLGCASPGSRGSARLADALAAYEGERFDLVPREYGYVLLLGVPQSTHTIVEVRADYIRTDRSFLPLSAIAEIRPRPSAPSASAASRPRAASPSGPPPR